MLTVINVGLFVSRGMCNTFRRDALFFRAVWAATESVSH